MSAIKDIHDGGSSASSRHRVTTVELKPRYVYPLWFGGSASCCAVCLTHPLDLIKVRMQTSATRTGMLDAFFSIARREGALGFYNGLSAGIARQVLYGSTRFAIYETIKTKYKATTSREPPLAVTLSAAAIAGFIGGMVGNPADLANVRMQSDSALSKAAQRNYKHVIDALQRFKREEGWKGYTRGIWANAWRASAMTSCQLASYDAFKAMLVVRAKFNDNLATQFAASICAGAVATTLCSPIDVVKSRIMSMDKKKGIKQVVVELQRAEGFRWLFRGWFPSFVRTGPHTIATFLFLEQHKKIYRSLAGSEHDEILV